MKRGKILLIILVFLLVVRLVYAVDSGTSAVDSNNAGADTLKQTAAETGGNLKNIGANLTGSLNDRTEDLLEREVEIPGWLAVPVGLFLGAGGSIKIQYLIILISIWVMLLVVILSALDFIPLFGGRVGKFLASLAIMLLLSISGALKEVAIFFFDFWNMFSIFEEWSFWKIVLVIFLSLAIVAGALWLRKTIKKDVILTTADIKGKEAGAGIAMLQQQYETTKKKSKG